MAVMTSQGHTTDVPEGESLYWSVTGDVDASDFESGVFRRGDSAYVIVEGPHGARDANAQKLGGHLVAINDSDENIGSLRHLKTAINHLSPKHYRAL